MGNKWSRKVCRGKEDDLLQEVCKLLVGIEENPCLPDHSADRAIRFDLDPSFEADDFLEILLIITDELKEELKELLDALLEWTPSPHRQEEILQKLRKVESFGERFLQTLRNLMKEHQNIVEKIQEQEASLQKKTKTLKWLKSVIFTIFAGCFATAVICSIVAAALHAGPALVSIISAATSVASWGPLALWVDEMGLQTLEKLRFEKHLCGMRQRAEEDKERALSRQLEPVRLLVNGLKQRLENVHSSEKELPTMKENLQDELCRAIECINDSMNKVKQCKEELDRQRDKLSNRMTGSSNRGLSSKFKINTLLLG